MFKERRNDNRGSLLFKDANLFEYMSSQHSAHDQTSVENVHSKPHVIVTYYSKTVSNNFSCFERSRKTPCFTACFILLTVLKLEP